MKPTLVILYVADQERSTEFYRALLRTEPILDEPGMTEFELPGGAILGLMPESGVRRLLPDLSAVGIDRGPRCEIYLDVDDAAAWHQRAVTAGAADLAAVAPRAWGDDVGYVLDPDGHVLAFATES